MKHLVPLLWLALSATACATDLEPIEPPLPTEVPPADDLPSAPRALTAEPIDHRFPARRPRAAPSPAQLTRITNTSGEAVGPLVIDMRGQVDDFEIDVAPCQGVTLAPGAACEVSARFHPASAGPFTVTVVVRGVEPRTEIRILHAGTGLDVDERGPRSK